MRATTAVVEGRFQPKKPPKPPANLGAEAAAEWNRVVPVLQHRRVLGDDMLTCLEFYCSAVARARTYMDLLEAEGHVVKGSHGGTVPHPAAKLLSSVMREVRYGAAEMGLTPAKRGKTMQSEKGDPWSAMLA